MAHNSKKKSSAAAAAEKQFWSNPTLIQQCYDSYLQPSRTLREGACRILRMQSTKEDGYVQVTVSQKILAHEGQLKVLGHHLPIALKYGRRPDAGEHASHLCGNPRCITGSHLIIESPRSNESRKGCPVYIECAHCDKVHIICKHNPLCYKCGMEGEKCEQAERKRRHKRAVEDGASGGRDP